MNFQEAIIVQEAVINLVNACVGVSYKNNLTHVFHKVSLDMAH